MKAFFKSSGGKAQASADADATSTAASAASASAGESNPNPMSTTSDDGGDSVSASGSSKTKQSQARRAQVRSAQIRHRQRKANYITELEREVNEYRDLIAAAEKVAAGLRGENETMRKRLIAAGFDVDAVGSRKQQMLSTPDLSTVTLSMDEAMGTPSFSISSPSVSDQPGQDQSQPGASPYNSHDSIWLTMAQEETAVNFILALEHICWNHFHSEHNIAHRVFQTVTNQGTGHTLMASAYCMAAAPESIYKDRKSLPSTASPRDTPTAPSPSSSPPSLRWSAPRISLQNLRGLADSLNPGDLELTPVQAWFELADRYPIALLLEGPGSALETLKRELRGLVKCLHYGAVIEREAFESVVTRVMDPALWELQQSLGIDIS